jgi:DNA-directed RNA polymerase specialized sigma24 family protein
LFIYVPTEIIEVFQYSSLLVSIARMLKKNVLNIDELAVFCYENEIAFHRVLSELRFRGCTSHSRKSAFAWELMELSDFYLKIEVNRGLYKLINYKEFGLIDISYLFNIRDDRFFHLVNLVYFKVFNSNLDVIEFKNHLVSLGFSILKISKSEESTDTDSTLIDEESIISEETDNNHLDIDKFHSELCFFEYPDITSISQLLISAQFPDLEVMRFLSNEDNLNSVSKYIEIFNARMNVTSKKIKFTVAEYKISAFKKVFDLNEDFFEFLPDILIEELLSKSEIKLIAKYLRKLEVIRLPELTYNHLVELYFSWSLGQYRIRNFLEIITEFKNSLSTKESDDYSIFLSKVITFPSDIMIKAKDLFNNSKFESMLLDLEQRGINNVSDMPAGFFEIYLLKLIENDLESENIVVSEYYLIKKYIDYIRSINRIENEYYLNTNLGYIIENFFTYSNNESIEFCLNDVKKKKRYFDTLVDYHGITQLYRFLPKETNSFLILSSIFDILDRREHEIIEKYCVDGYSISEIASETGQSPARVNRTIFNVKRRINEYINTNRNVIFYGFTNYSISCKPFVFESKIIDVFGVNIAEFLKEFITIVSGVHYSEYFHVYTLNDVDIDKMIDELNESYDDEYNMTEDIETILTGISELQVDLIDQSILVSLLPNIDSVAFNNLRISQVSPQMNELVEVLSKIVGGIDLSKDLLFFINIYNELYSKNLENTEYNLRLIDIKLRNSKQSVFMGSFSYIHMKYFCKEYLSIDTLRQMLLEVLSIEIRIDSAEYFERNLNTFRNTGIKNSESMFYIAKHFFDEIFTFGSGITKWISLKGNSYDLDNLRNLVEKINDHGGSLDIRYARNLLGMKKSTFDKFISSNQSIVRVGSMVYLRNKLGIIEEKIQKIIIFVQDLIDKKGFSTLQYIFYHLNFDPILYDFFIESDISSAADLEHLVLNFVKNVKKDKNSSFLTSESQPYMDFYGYLKSLDHSFDRDWIRYTMEELMYSTIAINTLLADLNKNFHRLSRNEYIRKELVEINGETLKVVTEFVDHIISKEYFLVESMEKLNMKLPKINYRWTHFLLNDILIENGYRQINREYRNHLYDKLIVVKDNSWINDFDDLLLYVLINEFKQSYKLKEFSDFLKKTGIYSNSIQSIPYELKESKHFEIDVFENILVKEL